MTRGNVFRSPLTKEQLVLAFSRAAMECKHFPVPALLRDFASIGEPVAAEAKEELFRIVAAMRGQHGWKAAVAAAKETAAKAKALALTSGKSTDRSTSGIRARGTTKKMARMTELKNRTSVAVIPAQPPAPVWAKDAYERIDGGERLVRVTALQGPEWVRSYGRWSLRIECCTMDEPGTVSAFVNLGRNRERPVPGGRKSKFYRWWCMANGAPPRRGEAMDYAVFMDKCFWALVSDSKVDENGKSKQEFEIYSRITDFLRAA
jgi:hypothetical protein